MTSTTLQLSDRFGLLSYREVGAEHAEDEAPLLLLHGVGMQSAAWAPQMAALSQHRHVIALDMPGHGVNGAGSTPLPQGSELPVFVDWLLAALDGLGLRQVNLVGHSMGALIAGGFTVEYPDRVARVALLNGVFRRNATARAAVIARANMISTGHFDIETPLQRWFGDSEIDRAARAQVKDWLSTVNRAGYATAYSAFAHGDDIYADGFASINCPLLALTGAGDPNSSPAMSRAMANHARRGRAVIIEKHRHMVNLTAPEAVNAALEEWLQTPLEERPTA